jgi:primase-polymerase (primpol)-like protein
MRTCERCGERIDPLARADARSCSARCRVAANRARRRLPVELTAGRRWVRADGKRPIRCDGAPASSTDPRTWATLAEVWASSSGDGMGVMLGGGLGCWDLDHALVDGQLTTEARARLALITEPVVWVERSVSGAGLHVFVKAAEGPGSRRPGVERYTRARFIRVTGDRFGLRSPR